MSWDSIRNQLAQSLQKTGGVLTGTVSISSGNLQFSGSVDQYVMAGVGKNVGFAKSDGSDWLLKANDTTYKVNTRMNVLDDGSGGMTIAGTATFSNGISLANNKAVAWGGNANIVYDSASTMLATKGGPGGWYVANNANTQYNLKVTDAGNFTSRNNTLDDGTGGMNIIGSIFMLGPVDQFIRANSGKSTGFFKYDQSSWILKANDATNAVTTKNNTLDNGSGIPTFVSAGGNRQVMTLRDTSLASGNAYSSTIRFMGNNASYWDLYTYASNHGSFNAANDAIAFWYDPAGGTGVGGPKFSVLGSGVVSTKNNTLDDGIGNLFVKTGVFVNRGSAGGGLVHYFLRKTDGTLLGGIGLDGDLAGSNAGGHFNIWQYDDSGNFMRTALQIIRSTGQANFGGPVGLSRYALIQPQIKDYSETTFTSAAAGSVDLNVALGNVFDLTLTGNITSLTLSNPAPSGQSTSITVFIRQGATAYTVAWPASVQWNGGAVPTFPNVNKTSIVTLVTVNGGTRWYGFLGGNNFVS